MAAHVFYWFFVKLIRLKNICCMNKALFWIDKYLSRRDHQNIDFSHCKFHKVLKVELSWQTSLLKSNYIQFIYSVILKLKIKYLQVIAFDQLWISTSLLLINSSTLKELCKGNVKILYHWFGVVKTWLHFLSTQNRNIFRLGQLIL